MNFVILMKITPMLSHLNKNKLNNGIKNTLILILITQQI